MSAQKVIHPQAHDNYRVFLKLDGDEFEIGSIGIQHGGAWAWGIQFGRSGTLVALG